MLGAYNAFGSGAKGGMGLLGDIGSSRGFAALNVVKVCQQLSIYVYITNRVE
jgi:hypothetical protein